MSTQTAVKAASKAPISRNETRKEKFIRQVKDSKYLIILVLPCIIYYILFKYVPMWGILISFKKYSAFKGFMASPWVGLQNFYMFFNGPFWIRCVSNTVILSIYGMLWGFPAPIILALILNDVQNVRFKKLVQTVSYMPHFLSTVIVVSLFYMFLSPATGPVQKVLASMGFEKIDIFAQAKYFRTIYISSGLWQSTGWGAIIYLAALTGIDPALYESAKIDGASKFQQLKYITLPSIAPTIVTMLLLRLGHVLGVGFEKVYLLQNDANHATSDVLETYVYRMGIAGGNYSYGTAIGLLTSVINLGFIITFNKISKKVSETSLW